jgi:hypothetical protein
VRKRRILADIAEGTGLQGAPGEDCVVMHAEHQDARIRIVDPQPLDQLETAQPRQIQIEND